MVVWAGSTLTGPAATPVAPGPEPWIGAPFAPRILECVHLYTNDMATVDRLVLYAIRLNAADPAARAAAEKVRRHPEVAPLVRPNVTGLVHDIVAFVTDRVPCTNRSQVSTLANLAKAAALLDPGNDAARRLSLRDLTMSNEVRFVPRMFAAQSPSGTTNATVATGAASTSAFTPRLIAAAYQHTNSMANAMRILMAAGLAADDPTEAREVSQRFLRQDFSGAPETAENAPALAADILNHVLACGGGSDARQQARSQALLAAASVLDPGNQEIALYRSQGFASLGSVASPPVAAPSTTPADDSPAGPFAGGLRDGFDSRPRAFLRQQCTVSGLVVVDMGGGKFRGAPLDVIATTTASDVSGQPFAARFTYSQFASPPSPPGSSQRPPANRTTPSPSSNPEKVGDVMRASLCEAERAVRVRYPVWDTSKAVEVTFGNQHLIKDGPSATTAFALSLAGLLDNIQFSPDAAITGDLSRDWVMRPVGGISGKIAGAARSGCKRVVIPADNLRDAGDLLVLGQADIFWRIDVLTASNLVDAVRLMRSDSDRNLADALTRFARVRKGFETRMYSMNSASPSLQRELQEVLNRAPEHLSARLLLLQLGGRFERRLSLNGSLQQIVAAIEPLLEGDYSDDACRTAREQLTRARVIIDSRASGCYGHAEDLIRHIANNTWGSARASLSALATGLRNLQADTSVPEALPQR